MRRTIMVSVYACLFVVSAVVNQANGQANSMVGNEIVVAGVRVSGPMLRVHSSILSPSAFDTIFSFSTPATWAAGLAWDGVNFWNSDADSQLIYKLSPSGQVLKSFRSPDSTRFCADLTWDGTHLWLVDEQLARLFKIDTAEGSVLASFKLPDSLSYDPNSFGLAWDGSYLWHSQYGDSAKFFKLNPDNGRVVSSFIPSKKYILGIEWVAGFLYGISLGESPTWTPFIYKINPSSGLAVDSASWKVPYPLGLVWDGTYFWNVSSKVSLGGRNRIYKVTSSTTFVHDHTVFDKGVEFNLLQNYPNPFNPSTTISYQLPKASFVVLKIFDVLGRELQMLLNERQGAGEHSMTFNASQLPSGVYFYRLEAGSFSETKKLILLR